MYFYYTFKASLKAPKLPFSLHGVFNLDKTQKDVYLFCLFLFHFFRCELYFKHPCFYPEGGKHSLLKTSEVSWSFRDILTFAKIMFQRLGDGVPTATSSALERACGYCRPVFVHYPNIPREMRTSHDSFDYKSTFYPSKSVWFFYIYIKLCNLKTERFSDDRHMIGLCTIYWQVRIFTHYPSVQVLQCHLGLVPVAKEWQPDNNKQPCISIRLKEKNPLQYFTHTKVHTGKAQTCLMVRRACTGCFCSSSSFLN